MNRIYQGRVSKVKMANPDKKAPDFQTWLPFHRDSAKAIELAEQVLPLIAQKNEQLRKCGESQREARKKRDTKLLEQLNAEIAKLSQEAHDLRKHIKQPWEDALWNHHQTFQDGVNYYTLALVALGEGLPADHPISKLRGRMELTWDEFPREVVGALSLGQSLRRWLGMAKDGAFSDAIKAVLDGLVCPQPVKHKALGELLEALASGSDGVIQQKGREFLPMFAVKNCEATFPREATMLDRRIGYFRLQTELHDLKDDGAIASFAKEASCYWTANPDKGGKDKPPLAAIHEAIKKLEEDAEIGELRLATKTGADFLSECKSAVIDHQKNKLTLLPVPVTNKGGEPKAAMALFKQFPCADSLALLRHYFPAQEDAAKEEKRRAKAKKDLEEAFAVDASYLVEGKDPIEIARKDRGFVFPAFTSLEAWATKSHGDPAWREFDIAAFKEALKTISQFHDKTKERRKRHLEAEAELKFINGKNADWVLKTSDEEEAREVFILAGDPRYEKLLKLLREMDEDRAERTKEEIVGPTEAALRGFGKLRGEWMDLYRQQNGK